MLLRSLFCVQGRDTGIRLAAISVAGYLLLSLWTALFGGNLALLIPFGVSALVILASGYRRQRDSQKPSLWSLALLLPLFCYGLVLFYLPSATAIGLCWLMATVFTGVLAFFPARSRAVYIQGYEGPAKAYQMATPRVHSRVEPVIEGANGHANDDAQDSEHNETMAPKAFDVAAHITPDNISDTHSELKTGSELYTGREQQAAQASDAVNYAEVDDARVSVEKAPAFTSANIRSPQEAQHIHRAAAPGDALSVSSEPVDHPFEGFSARASHRVASDAITTPAADPETRVPFESWHDEELGVKIQSDNRRGEQAKLHQESVWDDDDIDQSGSLSLLLGRWFAYAKDFYQQYQMPIIWGAGAAGTLAIVISLGVMIMGAIQGTDEANDSAEVSQQVDKPKASRQTVKMPDGFNLALEQKVLFVSWLGDTGKTQTLWDLSDAQGDKRCAYLAFNNGTQYRPLTVKRLSDTRTEAQFSPLDTEAILKDMALRGSVDLCGYQFSLKGSQAAMSQNAAFRRIIE